MTLRTLLCLLLAVLAQQPPPAPTRPRDPWVVRCALDGRPRMVYFALDPALSCAYDAQRCSFYAAWKGGVRGADARFELDGASYTRGFDERAWEVYVDRQLVQADVRWGGYWMHDQRCTLLYEIALPDGRHFQVRETPEYVRPEQLFPEEQMQDFVLTKGDTGLWRSFQLVDAPPEVKVCLRLSFAGVRGKYVDLMEREQAVEHEGWVVLLPERPFISALLFWKPLEGK